MLEDINHLLQFAEIPELFNSNDIKEICQKMEIIDNQRDKSLQVIIFNEYQFNIRSS